MTETERKAHRGANYLDRKRPNWYKKIKITTLDISDCNQCILGQLFGVYTVGLGAFNLSWQEEKPYECGFISHFYNDVKKLTLAWKNEIRIRRKK